MPTTITDHRSASMRVLVLCAVSVMSAVAAGQTTVLTLEQALARALSEGSATLIAVSERERAAARARQARAWENPTLSVEVENILGRGPYRDFDAAESTVSLSQPLPLGGGRGARVRAAQSDEQAATAALALAALELRRDVAIAYAEAIAADRLAGIARVRRHAPPWSGVMQPVSSPTCSAPGSRSRPPVCKPTRDAVRPRRSRNGARSPRTGARRR